MEGAGDMIPIRTKVAFTFHGIGMIVYGQRDYWPDGSFVATEWFVIAFVPLIPICSKRISYRNENPHATRDRSGYYVYETLGVDRKQAVCVYAWFASIVAAFLGWNYYQDALAATLGNEDRAAGLFLASIASIFALPYLLRRWAKRRKEKEWKRARLGLG
jgi:hypothetical protein